MIVAGRAPLGAAVVLGVVVAVAAPARAEVNEIRLAKQFSMGYVQFNVVEDRKLIEKYAREAGLGEVKVTWATFNGPNNMNEALLSDSVDVVAGGVPGLVTLWGKTRGSAQAVRGISALSSQPFFLNTRRKELKTLADLGSGDKIAVPAIKVSVQAVTLQMAAAKLWGEANFAKLDPLTVSISPPDATVALLTGKAEVTAVFSVPPYQQQQLADPAIHKVLDSYEVLGGPHTFTCAWTSARFHDQNPKLYGALVKALGEATKIINDDKAAAAELWAKQMNSKLPIELVKEVIAGPKVEWTMTPQNTMKYAEFMVKTGAIKQAPKSWSELFFAELHDRKGS
jgi:NitT/TauT family transport system substrate-binding protein